MIQTSLASAENLSDTAGEKFAWLTCLSKLSRGLAASERYIGRLLTGFVLGFVLLLIAAMYVTPALQCINNGMKFSAMSGSPFHMDDIPFRHRILAPVVAYYLGLSGSYFIYFTLLLSAIFLGVIYFYFRQQGCSELVSLAASSTMAFSSPILFLLHFQCYSDILTHLLLFCCIMLRRSRFIWVVPLALASLNHEAGIFSIPWVVFLKTRYYGRPLLSRHGLSLFALDVFLGALSVAPMLLLKKLWPLQNAEWRPEIYLAAFWGMWKFVFPYAGIGIFEAFKLFWLLPIFAMFFVGRGERCSTFVVLVLMSAAGIGQLLFSHDISRHVGHAFPVVLYSLELIARKKVLSGRLAEVLVILVLCNFFVPQYYIGQHDAWPFVPVPVSFLLWLLGFDPWNLPFSLWT